jgi:capsular polysaccharide biosynthesis protein
MGEYQDELDLRPYIVALLKNWWIVAVFTIVPLLVFLGTVMLRPRAYEARASVLIVRNRTNLDLTNQFQNVQEPVDQKARQEAFLTIMQQDDLAARVKESLTDQPTLQAMSVPNIKRLMNFSVKGDLILVSATTADPNASAALANAWAVEGVQVVNAAYSQTKPQLVIEQQLSRASDDYRQAQKAIEDFLANNRTVLLETQIESTKNILEAQLGTQDAQASLLAQRISQMDDLIIKADAIKRQLQSGSRSTAGNLGDALAVIAARASALGINQQTDGTRLTLQLDSPAALTDTSTNLLADMDQIMQLAQTERDTAAETLRGLSTKAEEIASLPSSTSEQLATYQAQLETQQAELKELTAQRDLAWSAFTALDAKATELRSTAETNAVLSQTSAATPPMLPTTRNLMRNLAIVGILGLLLGMSFVWGRDWWQRADMQALLRAK